MIFLTLSCLLILFNIQLVVTAVCGVPVGNYGLWHPWERCNASCGGGIQRRWRSLCCPLINGSIDSCLAMYNRTNMFIFEYQTCSGICFNGGTYIIGTGCVCAQGYDGICCSTVSTPSKGTTTIQPSRTATESSSSPYRTTGTEYTLSSTSWWHFATTTGYSLENVISSSCTSSGWYIQVNMYLLGQIYPDARASDIYLGENSCTGSVNGYKLVFQHGIRNCQTSETSAENSLVYRNRLFYAMRDPQHPFIIRGYNWTVDVECDVMRNETVSSHISHQAQKPFAPHHAQSTSHYNVTLRFYSDPNFLYEIPGNPLHVKVGEDVYVKAYTDAADWGVKMSVHSCYTKPDPYASDSMKYYIIRNGCEADVNTHYISQSSHETKFVFRDFEYTSNHEGLYIYCDATFCETSDYSYQCQQACSPRRKKRAESGQKRTKTVQ